jgi:cytochrome P450
MDSPIKSDFRLTKRTTALAGVPLPAGTPLAIFNGATNRDPGRFEAPHEFRVGRPNVREHIAFGRGIHSCPGAPLARSEGRVTVNRILSRTPDIRFSD